VIKSNKGQSFQTSVIMNSMAPQWNAEFTFGLGPSIVELILQIYLVEDDR